MAVLRWQWKLANGALVAATLDEAANREAVFVGERLASQCARGARGDGHRVSVAPSAEAGSDADVLEAVVRFDARSPICVLRVDDFEIAPREWPTRAAEPTRPRTRVIPVWPFVLVAVAGAAAAGAYVLGTRGSSTSGEALEGVHRASSGRFVAHYPGAFTLRLPQMAPPLGGISLDDKESASSIVLAAVAMDPSTPRDPWALQQRFHAEALASLPRGAARFSETERRDGACLGEAGAIVVGRASFPDGRPAKVWSCAAVRGESGYLALYAAPEPTPVAMERRLRRVVEATELTSLPELPGEAPLPR